MPFKSLDHNLLLLCRAPSGIRAVYSSVGKMTAPMLPSSSQSLRDGGPFSSGLDRTSVLRMQIRRSFFLAWGSASGRQWIVQRASLEPAKWGLCTSSLASRHLIRDAHPALPARQSWSEHAHLLTVLPVAVAEECDRDLSLRTRYRPEYIPSSSPQRGGGRSSWRGSLQKAARSRHKWDAGPTCRRAGSGIRELATPFRADVHRPAAGRTGRSG